MPVELSHQHQCQDNCKLISITPNMRSKWPLLRPEKLFLKILTYEAALIKHSKNRKFQQKMALRISFPRIAHHRMPKTANLRGFFRCFWAFCGAQFEESWHFLFLLCLIKAASQCDDTFGVMEKWRKMYLPLTVCADLHKIFYTAENWSVSHLVSPSVKNSKQFGYYFFNLSQIVA